MRDRGERRRARSESCSHSLRTCNEVASRVGAYGKEFQHRLATRIPVTPQLIQSLGQYGLTIVVLNVLLDQLGLPVPAVPTLIVAGAVASHGQMSLAALFAGSMIACLIADCSWYLVGQKYGISVLKTLCRISLEPDSCVSQTQTRFERWGVNSLVIAKFVPGLSTIAPPLAGAMRIGWLRFIFLSATSASLWVGAWLIAGALFRAQIERLLADVSRI